jgi:hypothetical protein
MIFRCAPNKLAAHLCYGFFDDEPPTSEINSPHFERSILTSP